MSSGNSAPTYVSYAKFLNKGLKGLRHRNKIIREEEISPTLPSPSKIYMHWGVWRKPCVIFRPDCGRWQRLSQAGLPGKALPLAPARSPCTAASKRVAARTRAPWATHTLCMFPFAPANALLHLHLQPWSKVLFGHLFWGFFRGQGRETLGSLLPALT